MSGQALEVAANSTADGGYYERVNRKSGKVLHVVGNATAGGTDSFCIDDASMP